MTFKARGLYASSSKEPRRSRMGLWLFLGGLLALGLVVVTVLSVLGNLAVTREQASDDLGGEAVAVENRTGGQVRVVAADVEEVRVERTLSTSPLRSVDETVEEAGGDVHVQAHCPGLGLFFSTCAADYEITVPVRTDLDVDTVSGEVTVSGLEGELNVETVSGAVTVQDHRGPVRADSTAGALELNGIEGSVEAGTVSGSIEADGEGEQVHASSTSGEVDLSGFTAQNVEASSTSGAVEIGDFTEAEVSTVAGAVEVRSGQDLESLVVDTTSGAVRARVPEAVYDVTGESTSGGRDIGVETSSGSDAQIRIDTVSGSVELAPV